jgi:monooxygenase
MEHLDVLVVGAGLSGVAAGYYLQEQASWASYAIFEARDAIGGTWDLFRYPGVRSDSDMYTLGFPFRPWTGKKAIADGASIRSYIQETAAEFGIDKKIRFRHRVVRADWSSDEGLWRITAERGDTGETVELTCGFLFSCAGYYRYDRGHQPEFPGVERFGGTVVHPQAWPADLDYADKRVVVIGSGATAITLIPSMAHVAGHVTMLQRSPTYITSMPEESKASQLLYRWLGPRVGGVAVRWFNVLVTQSFYELSRRRPETVKRMLRDGLKKRLPDGYDIDRHFTPSYNPWDQRMCLVPNGDLFKAIRSGKASVVTDHIDTFTETGIRLESGEELQADIVVTATGLEMLFAGGIELRVDDELIDPGAKLVYKSAMVQDVPNFAFALGYTNASWMLRCDLTCQFVARLLNRMRSKGMRQCTVVNSDHDVTPAPLFGLSAGYVQRAADAFPKQGSKAPWRSYDNYVWDFASHKLRTSDESALVLSNPRRAVVAR